MPITSAKCTNCGAILQVDNAKDAAICPYCHSAFIVDKAINNYNITNNIQAGVVNIYGAANDFDIRGGVLIKYNGVSMQPVIPNTVVKIGKKAFAGMMITSVMIPDSVIEIEGGAFKDCKHLASITLPDGVTVTSDSERNDFSDGAFSGCTSLAHLTIPGGMKRIEFRAFAKTTGLKQVTISKGVEVICYAAFKDCSNLQCVILPEGLIKIEAEAFSNTSLNSVVLPSTLIAIERSALYIRSLNSVTGQYRISKEKLLEAFESTWRNDDDYSCTPYGAKLFREIQTEKWRATGKCAYCGGELNIFRTCKNCKKKN